MNWHSMLLSINWLNALSVIKEVVVTVSAAIAAIAAVKGLNAWRERLRGNTEYELARRLLREVYNVRDMFDYARNPIMTIGEMTAAAREVQEDEERVNESQDDQLNQLLLERAAYVVRLQRLDEAFSKLRVESLEAEVLWGKDAIKPLDELWSCRGELSGALSDYLWYRASAEGDPRDRSEQKKDRKVVFRGGRDDKFTQKIRAAVDAIEEKMRPHLMR